MTFLRRVLVELDRKGLSALLGRLLIVFLCISPWAFRFERSSFRMDDVDPVILQEAQARGLNLTDPAHWPSMSGAALRLFAPALVIGLSWWLISRLRRWITLRHGSGALAVFVVMMGVFLPLEFLDSGINLLWKGVGVPEGASLPVWGGWVFHPLLPPAAMLVRLTAALLLGVLLVELVLQGLESRLQIAEARDGALRARLAPHFLFNTLNTLHAQIEEDPAGAQDTTERLGQLFRQVLHRTEQPTIPLREELTFVEGYLGIERDRMGERLKVKVEVTEEALDSRIPVLGLQTLVENAIRHGIEPRREGGTLCIEAALKGNRLWVSVEDPGDGSSHNPGAGKALDNLRARLVRPKDLEMARTALGYRVSFNFPQV